MGLVSQRRMYCAAQDAKPFVAAVEYTPRSWATRQRFYAGSSAAMGNPSDPAQSNNADRISLQNEQRG